MRHQPTRHSCNSSTASSNFAKISCQCVSKLMGILPSWHPSDRHPALDTGTSHYFKGCGIEFSQKVITKTIAVHSRILKNITSIQCGFYTFWRLQRSWYRAENCISMRKRNSNWNQHKSPQTEKNSGKVCLKSLFSSFSEFKYIFNLSRSTQLKCTA